MLGRRFRPFLQLFALFSQTLGRNCHPRPPGRLAAGTAVPYLRLLPSGQSGRRMNMSTQNEPATGHKSWSKLLPWAAVLLVIILVALGVKVAWQKDGPV